MSKMIMPFHSLYPALLWSEPAQSQTLVQEGDSSPCHRDLSKRKSMKHKLSMNIALSQEDIMNIEPDLKLNLSA
jgi:hypothetical protein